MLSASFWDPKIWLSFDFRVYLHLGTWREGFVEASVTLL